jgi:hypothetical protein
MPLAKHSITQALLWCSPLRSKFSALCNSTVAVTPQCGEPMDGAAEGAGLGRRDLLTVLREGVWPGLKESMRPLRTASARTPKRFVAVEEV